MSTGASSFFSPPNVRRGAAWLKGLGSESDAVVSSRIRLARNFVGFPFLTKATRAQRQEILDAARERLLSAGIAEQMLWVDVHTAPALDRTLMVERHLISKEHARGNIPGGKGESAGEGEGAAVEGSGGKKREGKESVAGSNGVGEPRGVAVSLPDETISIMVNEEDHLRLQVLLSGFELSTAFAAINEADDKIEGTCPGLGRALQYAFSPRFGYLTACPTNVGTGIRFSVMLHLPALKMTGEIEKVKRATRDMSLAVRGYYGEGSDAAGEFYQVSNQTTLGKAEPVILHELEHEIIPQIIRYERAARKLLLDKRRRLLEDKVFRALGTLRSVRLLTPEEAISLLSDVRLGIVCDLIRDVDPFQVNQLILLTQPAHLQRALGNEMDQATRRETRADMVREKLSV